MEFIRQEYWSGLPFPPPRGLLDPGIESVSLELAGRFFTTEPPRKPRIVISKQKKSYNFYLIMNIGKNRR